MKVYVLENGCYSDTHIIGLYSTKELAEMAARIFPEDANISEWEVDEEAEDMRRGCVPFFVRLNRETGATMECNQTTSSYGVRSSEVGQDIHKNLYTTVWAESRDKAARIASDRRRAFLALPVVVDISNAEALRAELEQQEPPMPTPYEQGEDSSDPRDPRNR